MRNKLISIIAICMSFSLLTGCGSGQAKGSGNEEPAVNTAESAQEVTEDAEQDTPEVTQQAEDVQQETEGEETMSTGTYTTQEIWVQNGDNRIYGVAYVPNTDKKVPLVIFSHELGNDHTSGVRYAERLAEAGYAAYVFDFCGGTVGGWIHVGKNYITDLWKVDFNQLLSSYQGHMLLLHGDKDSTVPLSYSEEAKEIIPDCEFYVIKDGGHEFFGQPFEDAMGYILPYLEGQINSNNEVSEKEEVEEMLQMTIGETPVEVKWEDNDSVDALKELCKNGPLSIRMSMYGGFEQVGDIGQSLPRNDSQTTTQSGDIVLYSGDQLVVFYGSNSWAYTRLGHVTDKSDEEMAQLLGNGDVVITIE